MITPEQKEFIGLLTRILDCVSTDQVYKHLRTNLDGHSVFLEFTGSSLCFVVEHTTILDAERSRRGVEILRWLSSEASVWGPRLETYYLLDLLGGLSSHQKEHT